MTQLGLVTVVTTEEVRRKKSLGAAIELCAEIAGFVPKEIAGECGFDKSQYGRWVDGSEGIKWHKLVALMDACGNHAPVLWMVDRLGYDISSLRRKESETERKLRLVEEELARVKAEHAAGVRLMAEVMNGRRVA